MKAFWIRRTHLFQKDEILCSACGFSAAKPQKVCPRCGAVMRGTKYDPSWVDEAAVFDAIFED